MGDASSRLPRRILERAEQRDGFKNHPCPHFSFGGDDPKDSSGLRGGEYTVRLCEPDGPVDSDDGRNPWSSCDDVRVVWQMRQESASYTFAYSKRNFRMSNRPIIGMNADYRAAARNMPAYSYIAAGYFQSIISAGGIPVVLPPLDDPASIAQVLDQVQGFVLIGGADLDPRNDGFMLHPSVRPLDPVREKSDRMLMCEIAERRMPLLGIGTGMQLLNVQQGGNLFLHLKEDLPSAVPHHDPQDPNHRHTLDVVSDSLVGRVYGDGEIRVSSRHHMAIDEVAPGFRVTARCPDGVIEAIESEMMDWFAIGTQFHPECGAASALDVRIFEEFVDGVRQRVEQDLRLVA